MAGLKLFPIAGMNNVSGDDALQRGGDAPKLFVRDALNVDISDTGRIALRKGAVQVSASNFKNIWQSPLHKDVFATLEGQLVKINTSNWNYEILTDIEDELVRFEIVNNQIFIASSSKIFTFNGQTIQNLSIDTPASPLVSIIDGGNLRAGSYNIAISWLRGQLESGLSQFSALEILKNNKSGSYDEGFSSIQLNFPYCLDASVTAVRVYITERNGTELLHYADFSIQALSTIVSNLDQLGMKARFDGLSPMPSGKFMKYWQGRLLTADKNILRFSEPLAYHLHDERFGFVMMPQKITFVLPVDTGIWIGQVTHVVFLTGTNPANMTFQQKTAHPPVTDSAIALESNDIGSDISQGGNTTALWLAENGYILGTSNGQIIELQAGVLKGITAKSGRSVSLGRRITTIVT